MLSFTPSLLPSGSHYSCKQMLHLGDLPPQHPLACDGYRRRQMHILLQTDAVSVEPDSGISIMEIVAL